MRPSGRAVAVSLSVLSLSLSLSLSACSSDDDSATTSASSPPASSTNDSTVTSANTSAPAQATTPTPETTVPATSFYGDFDTVIVQATDESGGGTRPLLEWEPVPDADHYGVYLYAPSGAAYWAWRGAETSVYVGGAQQIREDAPGPSVSDGMAWAVVAYDTELLPIAASPMRPISP